MWRLRLMRNIGILAPLLSFLVILAQIYTSTDESFIIASTGVQEFDQSWSAEIPLLQITEDGLGLPKEDPAARKKIRSDSPVDVTYRTIIGKEATGELSTPTLYIPGIVAQSVEVRVNGAEKVISRGDLPFFIELSPNKDNQVELKVAYVPGPKFFGFIQQALLVGNHHDIYKAHHRFLFRSFPRQASIVFLLAVAALTFAFFVFLDRKAELFALGVSVCALGLGEAIRVGLIPRLGSAQYFWLFWIHVAGLVFYARQLSKSSWRLLPAFTLMCLVALVYALTLPVEGAQGSQARFVLIEITNAIPIFAGGYSWYRFERKNMNGENPGFVIASFVALILYGAFLLSYDISRREGYLLWDLNQIPVLLVVMTCFVGALSSLGSLEKRVELAVKDREERLKLEGEMELAQEVQEAFIKLGVQRSQAFDVRTLYKASRRVGGDWVAWRELGDGSGIGVIADVVGKGVQAGLIVSACDASLQSALDQLSSMKQQSSEAKLRHVIRALHQAVFKEHPKRTMTALFVLAEDHGELLICSLGHPPFAVFRAEKVEWSKVRNPWFSKDIDTDLLRFEKMRIHEKDTFMVFTDGVCEGSQEMKKLSRELLPLQDKDLSVWEEKFAALNPDKDDQSVLLLRYRGDRRLQKREIEVLAS